MAYDLREAGEQFYTLTERMVAEHNTLARKLNSLLSDKYMTTRSVVFGEAATIIIKAYNEAFHKETMERLTQKWSESDAALKIMIHTLGESEEAYESAASKGQAILDMINDLVVAQLELPSNVDTSHPDMSRGLALFAELASDIGNLAETASETKTYFDGVIESKANENDLALTLKPLAAILLLSMEGFFSNAKKEIDILEEDFRKKSATRARKAEESVKELSGKTAEKKGNKEKKENQESKGSSSKKSGGGGKNSGGETTADKIGKKLTNMLELLARKMLDADEDKLKAFMELTAWLAKTALNPAAGATLPFEAIAKLLDIYGTFFKDVCPLLEPQKINEKMAEQLLKSLLADGTKSTASSAGGGGGSSSMIGAASAGGYSIASVGGAAVQAIKGMCGGAETPENAQQVQQAFAALGEMAAMMSVPAGNSAAAAACQSFNALAAQGIYGITGASAPALGGAIGGATGGATGGGAGDAVGAAGAALGMAGTKLSAEKSQEKSPEKSSGLLEPPQWLIEDIGLMVELIEGMYEACQKNETDAYKSKENRVLLDEVIKFTQRKEEGALPYMDMPYSLSSLTNEYKISPAEAHAAVLAAYHYINIKDSNVHSLPSEDIRNSVHIGLVYAALLSGGINKKKAEKLVRKMDSVAQAKHRFAPVDYDLDINAYVGRQTDAEKESGENIL
jgi:hypothetical protein